MEKRAGILVIFLSLVLIISSCDLEKAKMSPDVPFVVTNVELEDIWCSTGETDYCDHGEHYQIVLSYDPTGGYPGEYLTFYFTLVNDDGCEIFSHDGFMIDWHSYGTDGFRDQVAYHDCAFGERIFISEAYLKNGADGEIVQVLTPDQLSGEFLLGVPGYRCGNDICEMYGGGFMGESCLNCPLDCGECDGADPCGDGYCSADEDCESCPFDCGECDGDESDCYDDCSIDGCEGEPCGDEGYICDAETCELVCDDGEIQCGIECVDPMIDENYCGDCITYCSAGQECILGICEEEAIGEGCGSGPACSAGEICMDGVCVVIEELYCYDDCSIDGCEGEPCGDEGYICDAETCELICDDLETKCGEICVDTMVDENYCGDCAISCSAGYSCVAGICEEDFPGPSQGCILNHAYWEVDESDDEFVEGDVVTLTSFGNLACQGETLNFEVFEDDGIWDDPVVTNPLSVNFVLEDSEVVEWSEISSWLETNLVNVWGSSANDVYIVSTGEDGKILHYDGASWEYVGLNVNIPSIRGIWGSSANDVYAVATQNKSVFHFDGVSWEMIEMGASNHRFKSIWGSSANDVYLGGLYSTTSAGGNPSGAIFHYDGTSWEEVVRDDRWNYFKDMWGSSADNVYAVGPGNAGKVLHYDGISWEEEIVDPNMPGNKYFTGIWGSSANDVYVVGKPGSNSELYSNIYHFDGVSWERINTGTDYNLIDIWGSSSEDIYSVGWDGKILHYGITPYTIAEGYWVAETQRDNPFGSPEYYFVSSLSTSRIDSVDLLREE